MAAKYRHPNFKKIVPAAIRSTAWFGDLVLMIDVFCACIETGTLPKHGSPCHRLARRLVKDSGRQPKRKRKRLSPNRC